MFRSDTALPVQLTTLHVKEAFLYEYEGCPEWWSTTTGPSPASATSSETH
jgi:hypothetical protein